MAEQVIKAASNADLANSLLDKAINVEEPQDDVAPIVFPPSGEVTLPGGFISAGEVITKATVRELTGKDEEAIAKTGLGGKMFNTILTRAVETIGGKPVTEAMLDSLLAGDRDALLLGIYKSTFGDVAELGAYCTGCQETKTVGVEVDKDIKTKVLVDPIGDRTFTVKGRTKEFLVTLPTGVTQKMLIAASNSTFAEQVSILLEQTVLQIDGRPVVSKSQVQNLGVLDRQTLAEEITSRNPGPQFDTIKVNCPDCGSEVSVPISLGDLFRV